MLSKIKVNVFEFFKLIYKMEKSGISKSDIYMALFFVIQKLNLEEGYITDRERIDCVFEYLNETIAKASEPHPVERSQPKECNHTDEK